MSITTWTCVCPACKLTNIVKKVGVSAGIDKPPVAQTCYGDGCGCNLHGWLPSEEAPVTPAVAEIQQLVLKKIKNFLQDTMLSQTARGNDPSLTPSSIDATLDERGRRYGSWADNSSYAQDMLAVIDRAKMERAARNQLPLTAYQENSMVMICQKMSRILSGDAEYEDNWVDIEGYARLGRNPR